jgi:diguanylate cyclase (GGDEF)-like protein/PAS domain S-box-containing protein
VTAELGAYGKGARHRSAGSNVIDLRGPGDLTDHSPPPTSTADDPATHLDRNLLAAVFSSAVDAVIILDRDGTIETINPAAERLLGYTAEELVGQNVRVLLPGSTATSHDEYNGRQVRGEPLGVAGASREIDLRRRDGDTATVEISVSEVRAEGRHLIVGIARNIEPRRQAERDLRRRASTDPLTGLLNRASLHRALARSMVRVDAGNGLALVFLDLDDFKAVNDTFGHQVGDRVLRFAGERLLTAVRRSDLVSRYGGDEFLIVVESEVDIEVEVAAVSARIRHAFDAPFSVDGRRHVVGVSMGIAIHPDDGASISQLVDHADREMYREKAEKRQSASPA